MCRLVLRAGALLDAEKRRRKRQKREGRGVHIRPVCAVYRVSQKRRSMPKTAIKETKADVFFLDHLFGIIIYIKSYLGVFRLLR